MTRIPAETFPPGEFIQDELDARGWSTRDLAERMGGNIDLNQCTVELLINEPDPGVILDDDTAAGLGLAFGISATFFTKIDRSWRALARAG